jgi:tRNA(fMet)-specific endonuclease VapC
MGLILDSSILIASERGKFDMPAFLRQASTDPPAVAAVTASELLHGVERASDASRKRRRQEHVEQVLASMPVMPFGLVEARCHARIWADLELRGVIIGPHDLQIAATAVSVGYAVATLNAGEFQRVTGLNVIDASAFRRA